MFTLFTLELSYLWQLQKLIFCVKACGGRTTIATISVIIRDIGKASTALDPVVLDISVVNTDDICLSPSLDGGHCRSIDCFKC